MELLQKSPTGSKQPVKVTLLATTKQGNTVITCAENQRQRSPKSAPPVKVINSITVLIELSIIIC